MNPSGIKRWILFLAPFLFSFRNISAQVNLTVMDVKSGKQIEQERLYIIVMGNELLSYEFSARFTNASAQPYSAQLTIKSDIRDQVFIPGYVEGWQEKSQIFPAGSSLVLKNEILIRPIQIQSVVEDSFYVEAWLRYGTSPLDQLDIARIKVFITVYPLKYDLPVVLPEPEYTPGFSNNLRWIPVKGTTLQEVYYFDRENPSNRKKAIQRLFKQAAGDTLETVFQELRHGHTYGYFVKAVFNLNGQSNPVYSDFVYSTQDAVPPLAVSQTQALLKNYNMVALTWKKAADALSGVDRYRIYKTVDTSVERLIDSVFASFSQGDFLSWQEHTDSLSIFHYRVTAVDKAGNEGDGVLSNELTMQGAGNSTAPPDPVPGNGSVKPAAARNMRGVVDTLRVPLNGRETAVRFQSVRDSLRYFKSQPVDGMRVFDSAWMPLDSITPDPADAGFGRRLFDYTGNGAVDSNFVNGHIYYRRVIRKILAVTDTIDLGSIRPDCFMPDDIRNLRATSEILDTETDSAYTRWRIALDWNPAVDAGSGLKRYHIFRKIDGNDAIFFEIASGRSITESQFSDSIDVFKEAGISNSLIRYRIVGEDNVGNVRPIEKTAWEVNQRALGSPDWRFVETPPFTSAVGSDTLFCQNDSVSFILSRFDLASIYRLVVEKNGIESLADLKGSNRLSIRLSDNEVTRFRIRALYAGGVSGVWTSFKQVIRALNLPVKGLKAWTETTGWEGHIYLKWARPSLDIKQYEIWRYRQNGDSVLAGLSLSKSDIVSWTDEYNRNEITGKQGDPLPVYETLRYRIHKINRFDQNSHFSEPAAAYSNRPPLITSSALKSENNGVVIQILWRRPYPNDVRKNFTTLVRVCQDNIDTPVEEDIVSNDDSLYTFRKAAAGRNYIFRIKEMVNDDPSARQSSWSRPYTKSLRELSMALQPQPKKRMYVAWDRSKVDSLRIQAFLVQRVSEADTVSWKYANSISDHMDSTQSLVHGKAYQYSVFALDSLNQVLAAGTKADTCDAGAAFIPHVIPFPMKYFRTPELDVVWEWKTVSGPPALHTTRGAKTCLIQVSLSRNFPTDTAQTKTYGPFSADPEKRSFKVSAPRIQNRDNNRLFFRMTSADAWGHPLPPVWSSEFYGLVEASFDTVKPKPVTDMALSGFTSYYKKSDFVLAGLTWTSVGRDKPGEVKDRLVSNVDRYRIMRFQDNVETAVFDEINRPAATVYALYDTIRNASAKWRIITIDSAGNSAAGGWIETPSLTPTPPPPKPSQIRGCKVQPVTAAGAKVEYFVEIAMRQNHFNLAYEVQPGTVSNRLICGSGWFPGNEYVCNTGWGSIETDTTFFRIKARIGSWESGWSSIARYIAAENRPAQSQQEEATALPAEFAVSQNYPNPFNAETRMILRMPENGQVEVHLYSITGSRIKTLVHGQKSAGEHTLIWDGRQDDGRTAASGIVLAMVTIHTEQGAVFQKRIKMMMIK